MALTAEEEKAIRTVLAEKNLVDSATAIQKKAEADCAVHWEAIKTITDKRNADIAALKVTK
jgi:hypothetical protein